MTHLDLCHFQMHARAENHFHFLTILSRGKSPSCRKSFSFYAKACIAITTALTYGKSYFFNTSPVLATGDCKDQPEMVAFGHFYKNVFFKDRKKNFGGRGVFIGGNNPHTRINRGENASFIFAAKHPCKNSAHSFIKRLGCSMVKV